MPLDPQVKAMIEQMAKSGMPQLETLSPAEARRVTSEMFAATSGAHEPVANVENRKIPGPAGEIPVRIYTPSGNGPFPVLMYYHGGGWVLGDLESHDAACRSLTNGARCVTVSVDYRLAPEHKFPAAVEDCYAATEWMSENAASLNADARRLAVGGDSAGGNLAAVVSLIARDRKTPQVSLQLLVYPATDGALDTYSHKTFLDYFLTHGAVVYFWNHYVRSEADKKNPHASPAYASDLRGLPPALVITAEFDPLRDEGEAYGRKLREAGVPVTVTRYDGMIHGFFTMGDMLSAGKRAMAEACEALGRAFIA